MQSWYANVPTKDDEELKNTFHIVQPEQLASEFDLRLFRKPEATYPYLHSQVISNCGPKYKQLRNGCDGKDCMINWHH